MIWRRKWGCQPRPGFDWCSFGGRFRGFGRIWIRIRAIRAIHWAERTLANQSLLHRICSVLAAKAYKNRLILVKWCKMIQNDVKWCKLYEEVPFWCRYVMTWPIWVMVLLPSFVSHTIPGMLLPNAEFFWPTTQCRLDNIHAMSRACRNIFIADQWLIRTSKWDLKTRFQYENHVPIPIIWDCSCQQFPTAEGWRWTFMLCLRLVLASVANHRSAPE